MYLAKKRIDGTMHYFIRETVETAGGGLRSRELLELGQDPSQYIIYPGGHAFYIDESIEEKLELFGVETDQDELEGIFWPFIRADIQRAQVPFRTRAISKRRKKMTDRMEERLRTGTHIFDKRRMHYLKFGRMNQGYVGSMSGKFLRDLDGKSRDEIEQYFWMTEKQVLKHHEVKIYVYTIFDLKSHFTQLAAKYAPESIEECQVDECFLDELCRLNCSKEFWAGEPVGGTLHDYLVRYLVMFFDFDFARRNLAGEIFRDFINRHKTFTGYPIKNTVSVQEASGILEVSEEDLQTITKKELVKQFRHLARKHHPDRGGAHEKFIALNEAFQSIMRRRRFKA